MTHEVVLTTFGHTYMHKKAARVGNIWRGIHNKDAVLIVYEVHDTYIKTLDVNNNDVVLWHSTNFYINFELLED